MARMTRRDYLSAAGAGLLAAADWAQRATANQAGGKSRDGKALVAITLDLEMSRNFPRWEDTHWDYEKGNLNQETKAYAAEAGRRVKASGGRLHYFVVGRVLEQDDVSWLDHLAKEGHPLGNHTYDHVHMKAQAIADVQFRFALSPWLVEGKTAAEVIAANVGLTNRALKSRIGVEARGFRTPGGFSNGLSDRPDLQRLLLANGFRWVSSKYPAHPNSTTGRDPEKNVYDGIVAAQGQAQPFVYESGLVEVPMAPISDIGAFRTGRWKLEWFLEALRRSLDWVIEHGAVFDFLGHPSCLYVTDSAFKAVDLILDAVAKSNGRAELVDLDAIAERGRRASTSK